MNAIAPRQAGAIAIRQPSQALARALDDENARSNAEAGWQSERRPLPQHVVDEAQARARAIADLPSITARDMAEWMRPINAAVRNPQGQQDFAARVAAITEFCHGIPACLFTPEARKEVLLSADGFFPSAANVLAAVQPGHNDLKREARHLRNMTAPASQPQRQAQADAAQLAREAEANMAKVAQLRAEADERARASRPAIRASKSRVLTPDELRMAYEPLAAAGNQAAIARLAALEGML
ncbi:hypothetical protein [Rhodovarius lipocyclicus]|uniref:hypothetical protein n=1 Tax=Rhodovarius lipocyclicus TaxID=268410 RepID=UPI00135A692C|nr:hypothetical protein [Rhodovarius lipocyclicus]